MCPGEKRKLTIPSSLGYGQRGAGNVIPGGKQLFDYFYKAKALYIAYHLKILIHYTLMIILGATLLFDVELVSISKS